MGRTTSLSPVKARSLLTLIFGPATFDQPDGLVRQFAAAARIVA